MKKILLGLTALLSSISTINAQSLNFDGTDDFISTNTVISTTNYTHVTFECWVKSPNSPTSTDYDGPMSGDNFGITWNHVNPVFQGAAFIKTGATSWVPASFGTLSANTWYHLAATYDGSTLKTYKNGILMNSVAVVGSLFNSSVPLTIGSSVQGFTFNGNIDEVRVWNIARTCAQINSTMNIELSGSEIGLTTYYKLNDGVPAATNVISNVLNSVNSTNDGVLNNFSLTGTISNFGAQCPFDAPIFCSSNPGSALNFDGVDSKITTPVITNSTTYANLTFECWVYSPNAPSNAQGYDGPVYAENFGICWNQATTASFQGSAYIKIGSNFFGASFGPLSGNTWYHLAATYDGTNLKAYKNGVLQNVTNVSGPIANTTMPLEIGRSTTNDYFQGGIDEVRIWNIARTCSEINANMNNELTGNESGLTAYYKLNEGNPFNNNTTITSVLNSATNTSDGTLSGFTLTGSISNFINNNPANAVSSNCIQGQASMHFDGNDDLIATPIVINPSTTYSNITFECWVKSPNIPNGNDYDGPMSGDNFGITWNHVNSAFQGAAFIKTGATSWVPASFGTLSANTWYHLAATYDGTTLKTYKNGVLINAAAVAGTFFGTSTPLTIGSSIQGFTFEGNVDEVRIWNVARTCSEINANMNSELVGNETGLTAYYKLNDGVAFGTNTSMTSVLNSVSGTTDASLGNFSLTGTASNFSSACPFNLPVNNCTATLIQQELLSSNFVIYPNPTSALLNVETKEQTQIFIMNVLGEVVKTEIVNGTSTIDVSELKSGVYFIQSTSGAKAKFIKN